MEFFSKCIRFLGVGLIWGGVVYWATIGLVFRQIDEAIKSVVVNNLQKEGIVSTEACRALLGEARKQIQLSHGNHEGLVSMLFLAVSGLIIALVGHYLGQRHKAKKS